MSKNIEIEAKAILTKDDYEKLLPFFSNAKSFEQINYYFDTKDFEILNQNAGLRVRKEFDYYELTLKEKSDVGKLEINQKISAKTYDLLRICGDFPNGEVANSLTNDLHISLDKIRFFGELKNERKELVIGDEIFCLDLSEYLGNIEYEIEVESVCPEKAALALKQLLKRHEIKYKENRIGKIQRLRDAVSR